MKNFKKVVATVIALVTIGSLSTMYASAELESFYDEKTGITFYCDEYTRYFDTFEDFKQIYGLSSLSENDVQYEKYYIYWYTCHNINNIRDISSDIANNNYIIQYVELEDGTLKRVGEVRIIPGDYVQLKDGTLVDIKDGNNANTGDYITFEDGADVYKVLNNGLLQTENGKIFSPDATINDSEPTIGDSNTIGESEEPQPTGVRGDINYDGKVDGKDLMLLKKYILGLITW